MKSVQIHALIVLSMILFACRHEPGPEVQFRLKTPPAAIYDMAYEPGNWPHPDYSKPFVSMGNHRIVLEVDDSISGPVQAVIRWRRPDPDPAGKAVLIAGAQSGLLAGSKLVYALNNGYCHLAFQPLKGESRYYVYYLPHRSTGSYYPKLTYLKPGESPDDTASLSLADDEIRNLPQARILSAQSIDDFHSFFPMEVIATGEEVEKFTGDNPGEYYLFPEYRGHPVRMDDHLPLHWVKEAIPFNGLRDTVKKGEYYTFQIGLWSPRRDINNVQLVFSDFVSKGDVIPAGMATCFNLGGTDLNGETFKTRLDIPANKVRPLWCGIEIPQDIAAGDFEGHVIIQPEGLNPATVYLRLHILNERTTVQDDIPNNMSRLKWLNSTIGSDSGFIAKPFLPVIISGKTLGILGREIKLGNMGLPAGIYSYFSQEMTSFHDASEALLAAPIEPDVILDNGHTVSWNPGEYSIGQESAGRVTWTAVSMADGLNLRVNGTLEYDGMLDYRISLIAEKDRAIDDFILHIPMVESAAEYMLGLGYKGCRRPATVEWKWDVAGKHQEGAWLGAVNKGISYVLRDENYERPLNTNFYRQKPLNAPSSWYNEGKGGMRIREVNGIVSVENYSGSRSLQAGDTLHFNIRFLITPFKLIDTKAHFSTRFVHRYVPIDSVVAWNGTVVNVHHANEINPYINYPFFNIDAQKAYIDEAHSKGVKVKLYNTIRELSYQAYELFPMRSLGYEIFNDGQGGGHSWLQEHLRDHYHAAWHATTVNDAAILNKGTSRWTNYYIEGINWLAEQQHIDGLYLDDIAFSRTTVRRLANVLQKHRDEVVIDLHSANQFNERDGFINSAFLYMEHMPYITRLWFGEYFEYDQGPDYWLTEVSGIPFGLTGEMLEGGGHPWRGLVYGMTTRIYGDVDPGPLWKLFDDYDMANSEMLGYWVERSPVKTTTLNIKCTAYVNADHVLVAIGSWSDNDENVQLIIDWKTLGLEEGNTRLYSPPIEGLQKEAVFDTGKPVPVSKQQGRVVILERTGDS